MNKYWFFIFSLLLSAATCLSQVNYTNYQFPKEIPKNYIIDAKGDYDALVTKLKPKDASKDDISAYCELVCYGKQNIFHNGLVYLNWTELENYLNAILQKILPDSLKGNPKLHVYPARIAEFNAFAISDGSLFVNIGYLSEIPNEAALAATMGHEITHFIKRDTYNSHFYNLKVAKTERKPKNLEALYNRKLESASYERSQETTADSIGLCFANNAGYDVQNAYEAFYLLLLQEKLDEKANKQRGIVNVGSKKDSINRNKFNGYLLSDHPGAQDRMKLIADFIQSHPSKDKSDYIVNESYFLKLKQDAKYEKLYILMEDNSYYDCLLSSFTYYLLEPENQTYHYYVLESLRKLIYTEDNQFLEHGFLNMHLGHLLRYNKGVLHKLELVSPDTSFCRNIKAKELADTSIIEFENYYQAFDYFLKEGLNKNIPEAYLIAAQRYYDDDDARKTNCEKYLSFADVPHKDYATALMKKELNKSLIGNKKDVFIANTFSIYEEHEKTTYRRYIKSGEYTKSFFKQFKKDLKKKYPTKEFILFDSLKINDFNRYVKFKQAIETPFVFGMQAFHNKPEGESNAIYFDDSYKPESEKTKNDLFLLDAGLWEFFKQEGLRTIEYCSTTSLENKTKLKLSVYKNWSSFYSVGFFKFSPNEKTPFFTDYEMRTYTEFDANSYSDVLLNEIERATE